METFSISGKALIIPENGYFKAQTTTFLVLYERWEKQFSIFQKFEKAVWSGGDKCWPKSFLVGSTNISQKIC